MLLTPRAREAGKDPRLAQSRPNRDSDLMELMGRHRHRLTTCARTQHWHGLLGCTPAVQELSKVGPLVSFQLEVVHEFFDGGVMLCSVELP